MAETLDKALRGVLGRGVIPTGPVTASQGIPETIKATNLSETALKHYNKAKELMRQGDWAGFGRELELLENALEKMTQRSD